MGSNRGFIVAYLLITFASWNDVIANGGTSQAGKPLSLFFAFHHAEMRWLPNSTYRAIGTIENMAVAGLNRKRCPCSAQQKLDIPGATVS